MGKGTDGTHVRESQCCTERQDLANLPSVACVLLKRGIQEKTYTPTWFSVEDKWTTPKENTEEQPLLPGFLIPQIIN